MGTWDIGPFDNDTAADFAGALDEVAPVEREAMVRGVLTRTLNASGYLDEAQEAVAAAALIAAQCPGGRQVVSGYGPQSVMPMFAEDLRLLAGEALVRIASDEFGIAESWVAAADCARWIAMIEALRSVLDPPPPSIEVPLFDDA
ncbi:DUF4259 domain-containing protein [Kitasatospora sp. NPDC096140]|uniref:DUF4259 domain-containing protein n=1 Tax=Kitasatospora sp. NPDC096140 TaxID=3155425 RepID=UPI0033260DCC